jgi:uncharacterized protein with ParB-like and HNH nuclease domain
MEPHKRTIYEFIFRTDGYFQIPDFQRPYTWDTHQIETFWSDLEKVAARKNSHYFGTIVLVRENDHSVVIDGQQRLTTSLLLINAAYHVLKNTPSKSPNKNYTADRLRDQFLVNTYSSSAQNREKITLRTVTTDNDVLEKIFNGEELSSNEKANKLYKAYTKFRISLETKDNIDNYIDALKKFEIVEIILDSTDDNPQLVFENINSTGEPLSAGDKIRNWALMLNNEKARQVVYNDYWKIIENKLTRVENGKQIDYISDFFRTYLMCKKDEFVSDANTYPSFKELLRTINDDDVKNIKAFYNDVMKYLLPYLSIKFMEISPRLEMFSEQIFSLKFLQTEIINTIVINLFVDFIDEKLSQEEVINSLYLVETFLARRMICGFKTEGLNMRFPELHKIIRTKQEKYPQKTYNDCLSAWMLEARGRTSALPTNADITNSIKTIDFYRGTKKYQQQYVLAKICDQSKESTLLHNFHDRQIILSVEHIMPQTLTTEWKSDLGSDCESIYSNWVHTLANLTLTAYNQKLSNRSFVEKKTMEDGFAKSPLLLNKYIAEFDVWNEDSLEKRALWLSEHIVKIWRYPQTSLPLSIEDVDDDEFYSPYDWEVKPHKKPAIVLIVDEDFNVSSWVDMYTKVLSFIQENFPEKFVTLIDNNDLFGVKDRPLITKDKNLLVTVGELSHGIFVERNIGVDRIMRYIIKVCEYVGYNKDDCPISFTVTTA